MGYGGRYGGRYGGEKRVWGFHFVPILESGLHRFNKFPSPLFPAICLQRSLKGLPTPLRYNSYEVLKKEVDNPRVKWAYLPYSMHMAGPRARALAFRSSRRQSRHAQLGKCPISTPWKEPPK